MIGLALLATLGFLLALGFGLGAATHRSQRRHLAAAAAPASQQRSSCSDSEALRSPASPPASGGQSIGYLVFYLALAILLAMVFNRAAFARPTASLPASPITWATCRCIFRSSTASPRAHNLPPEDPTYAGVRFAYPFLVDFLTAMLVRAGAGVISAMWLQNMVLALAFVGLLNYWTLLLTRNRLAGLIAPLLVLFSGGMGWWLLFSDVSSGDGLFSTLGNLQHDYTIVPNSILRWGNSLTTLFVPQRSILFGLPLAITIFCQWWLAISQQENARASATPLVQPAPPFPASRNSRRNGPQNFPKHNAKPPKRPLPRTCNLSRKISISAACWPRVSAPDCCRSSMPTPSWS